LKGIKEKKKAVAAHPLQLRDEGSLGRRGVHIGKFEKERNSGKKCRELWWEIDLSVREGQFFGVLGLELGEKGKNHFLVRERGRKKKARTN